MVNYLSKDPTTFLVVNIGDILAKTISRFRDTLSRNRDILSRNRDIFKDQNILF
jgi:hypothetical protein